MWRTSHYFWHVQPKIRQMMRLIPANPVTERSCFSPLLGFGSRYKPPTLQGKISSLHLYTQTRMEKLCFKMTEWFFFPSLYCWNVTDYVVLNLYTLFMVYVVKYSWNPEVIYLDQSIKIPVCFDMFMLIVYSRAYNSSCHNTGVDIQKLLLVTLLVFKIWLYFTVSAKCLYFP